MNRETVLKRNEEIDILKGILILAVVIGHISATLSPPPNYDVAFLHCYSWHMYCFMMVVGYIASKYGKIERNYTKLVIRFRRLMIPYISWTIIRGISLGHYSVIKILLDIFETPLYWFLIVQFIYELIVFGCDKDKVKWGTIILGGGGLVVAFIIFRTELLRQAVLYYPYYFLGYIYEKNETKLHTVVDKLIPLAAVLYPISMIFYSFKDRTIAVKRLKAIMQVMGLTNRIQELLVEVAYHGGFQIYNYVVVAILGSAFYFLIAKLINKHCIVVKQMLCILGKNTLQIFVISVFCYVTSFGKMENWVLSLVSCIAVPLLLTKLISNNQKLSKVMFGI